MNQETNTVEFKLFNADLQKMSDAELKASLNELRKMTMISKPACISPSLQQCAA